MAFKRKTGGVWTDPSAIRRRSGGAWVTPTFIKRRVGGSWVTVWPTAAPLSASASPSSVSGYGFGKTVQGIVTSNPTSVSASGGNGTYTFSWVRVSGDTTINPTNATGASTAFSATVRNGAPKSAVFRCDVTSGGVTVSTNYVSVTLTWDQDYSGGGTPL